MQKEKIRYPRQEQLNAWKLWKQICSINGCDPSTTRQQDCETDPKRRAMLHQYLIGQFCSSFNKRYFKIKNEKLSSDEIVSFLDSRIAEFAPKTIKQDVRHPKCFKDFVWLNAREKDDCLRYIAGTFIGPHSYMNDFVRDYLNTTSGHFEWGTFARKNGTVFKGQIYKVHESLDETDANGNTLLDNLPDPNEFVSPDQNLPDEENDLLKKLVEDLSIREKVVILATRADIPLYSPEVTAAAGVGRDGCYLAFKKAASKIGEILKEVNQQLIFIRELISMISDSLKSEKTLESFLLKVSDNNSTKETDHE